jgi:hypothetical protein
MILAYRNFLGVVGNYLLSPLNPEADQNNHGNHYNPINLGSDK